MVKFIEMFTSSQALQYFANSVQIGNRPEISGIWFGEPGLLQNRCDESMFEFWWESGLIKWQVREIRYENRNAPEHDLSKDVET